MGKNMQDAGYTLIEILIVIFIISIVSSAALLTISHNNNKQMEAFTNEFVQVAKLAEEQAMLQPAVLGLMVEGQSYYFVTLTTNDATGKTDNKTDNKTNWTVFEDNVLGKHVIPNNIQMQIIVRGVKARDGDEEKSEQSKPKIIFSTNGDVTPFTVNIGKKGAKPRYVVNGEADGSITSKDLQ